MTGMKKRQERKGNPSKLGITLCSDGYNFAIDIPEDADAKLLLYKSKEGNPSLSINLPKEERCGTVASAFVPYTQGHYMAYNYQIEDRLVQDPCARMLLGVPAFGVEPAIEDMGNIRCGIPGEGDLLGSYDMRVLPAPSYEDMILYKLHVRGYTKHKNSKVRKKGTFLGLVEKIPYWKSLGINAIELMPAYEFREVAPVTTQPMKFSYQNVAARKINYWGYTDGYYYAPKTAYCATKDPIGEFKTLVDCLHGEGIACIMEFYFKNTMNQGQIRDILRFWVMEYHVDGFHITGDAHITEVVTDDPLLRRTRLLLPYISSTDFYDKKESHKNLGEYSEEFKTNMRRFLKSDEDTLERAAYSLRHNPTNYAVINAITTQDGFTMNDLVSYDQKHNEENEEDNRDGNNYNNSWNCGVEGPSRKVTVRDLRRKQMHNAFLFLMLSQGTPLLYGGDEFCNSQGGNNNAYCQDNDTGWVEWTNVKRSQEMLAFVKGVIAFRRRHPVLHMAAEPRMVDWDGKGYPELSYHSELAWRVEFNNTNRYIGIMYGDRSEENQSSDDFIYIACNQHWETHTLALPSLPEKKTWRLAIHSGEKSDQAILPEGKETLLKDQREITVSPRTVMVLIGK